MKIQKNDLLTVFGAPKDAAQVIGTSRQWVEQLKQVNNPEHVKKIKRDLPRIIAAHKEKNREFNEAVKRIQKAEG